MIYLEENAREINIEGAIRVKGLEAITGADMMLSRIRIPPNNRALILKHVQGGALLVQVKKGEDLASSIGDRLNESLARMIETCNRQCQCVLMFIGVMTEDASGHALINGRRTHMEHDYRAVNRAISKWIFRGGVYVTLSRESQLAAWCDDQVKILDEMFAHPVKHIYQLGDYPADPPVDDATFQLPVRVKDARRLVFALDGMGYELTERVHDYCGSGKAMVTFLTDEANAGKVQGIGIAKIRSIRRQFELSEGERLRWESE